MADMQLFEAYPVLPEKKLSPAVTFSPLSWVAAANHVMYFFYIEDEIHNRLVEYNTEVG